MSKMHPIALALFKNGIKKVADDGKLISGTYISFTNPGRCCPVTAGLRYLGYNITVDDKDDSVLAEAGEKLCGDSRAFFFMEGKFAKEYDFLANKHGFGDKPEALGNMAITLADKHF